MKSVTSCVDLYADAIPSNKRLTELDALRAAAIGLILLNHLPAYIITPTFAHIENLIEIGFPVWLFGLSLFFFVSGFALCHSNMIISDRKDATGFLKKRALRIYPLYWVAIAAFIALDIGYWPDRSSIIIQICGAQGVLSPRFVEPVVPLWFVGVILLYYLLYLVFAALSYDAKYMFSAMLGFFFSFAMLRLAFNIIDFRFFLYYGIFIAGIIARRYNLLYGRDAKKSSTVYATLLLLVVLLTVASPHIIVRTLPYAYAELGVGSTSLDLQTVLAIALANAVVLLFIYASFNIARLTLPLMSKTTLKLILAISLASYCVYLFHMPFLDLLAAALGATRIAALAQDTIILVCGIPLLFLFGYALQVRTNNLIRKFIER
jgi:peptidoglycan/LPS O-acetylase OafA/YrhL